MSSLIHIERGGLGLSNGTRLPLISGSVHYWRLNPELWSSILDSIVEMGFRCVETYVPWSVHEVVRGRFDWGERDLAKNLNAFLSLCESKGLYVFLRPGPNIIAELTGYGFPQRILFDSEIQARTRHGAVALYDFPIQPAPIPCYACDKLYDEFALYLDALFEVIGPHFYPRGRVLALQADNELCYFFRLAMFDLDYAPASLALYRRYLAGRYRDIAELNRVYKARFRTFDQVTPPTEFRATRAADLPYYLDWARYKEYYLLYGLQRVAAMFRERGADDLLIYHNYPGLVAPLPTTLYNSPYHLSQAETMLDLCGVDSYPTKEMYDQVKSQAQYLVGTSRFPFVPEFGSGAWPWIRPPLLEDEEFTTLALLMHGVKAINLYMLVERDRWLGSPLTRAGCRRAEYFDFYRRFNDLVGKTDLLHLHKVAPIVLLANRDYARLAGVSAVFTPPSRQFLSFTDPQLYLSEERWDLYHAIALEDHRWWRAWNDALTQAGCTFDLSDSDLPLERLSRYNAAVVSSFDWMSRDVQEKLVAYARTGGRLILGPDVPYLDETMQRCSILGEQISQQDTIAQVGAGTILLLFEVPSWVNLPGLFRQLGIAPRVQVSDPDIDVTIHENDSRCLIYVANPTNTARTVSLSLKGTSRLKDLWTDDEMTASAVFLPPYTVRILEPFHA